MKLLLHSCCGPCSLEPTRILLEQEHDIHIAYSNSNIHPHEEYKKRHDTLVAWAKTENIPVTELAYDPEQWQQRIMEACTDPLNHNKERCRACYQLRLSESARFAAEQGFDGISTTLSVSPYQDSTTIEQELERAAETYKLHAVFQDFRPFYPAATQKSRELEMYRQRYCGCYYSEKEAEQGRERRKHERKEKRQRESR